MQTVLNFNFFSQDASVEQPNCILSLTGSIILNHTTNICYILVIITVFYGFSVLTVQKKLILNSAHSCTVIIDTFIKKIHGVIFNPRICMYALSSIKESYASLLQAHQMFKVVIFC